MTRFPATISQKRGISGAYERVQPRHADRRHLMMGQDHGWQIGLQGTRQEIERFRVDDRCRVGAPIKADELHALILEADIHQRHGRGLREQTPAERVAVVMIAGHEVDRERAQAFARDLERPRRGGPIALTPSRLSTAR